MTQELLLNVIKHARASHVALRVQKGRKQVRVLVEDNGKGFNFDMDRLSGKQSGIGLFSIRERLHSLDGELRIMSEKGQGCSISLIAPVMMNGECDDANPDSDDRRP
jgi:signal transduction histidine kinase